MLQISYSRLWDDYPTDRDALNARNKKLRAYRKKGYKVRGWALRNQLKKYESFGVPDGRSCTVYFIDIYDEPKIDMKGELKG